MSAVICPMLAALAPVDPNGQPVNRECIFDQCRFYNAPQQDCNISLGDNAVAVLAEEVMSRPGPEERRREMEEVVRPALDGVAALDGRADQINAAVERLAVRIDGIVEAQQKVAAPAQEEISRLTTGLQSVEQMVGSLETRIGGIEQALGGLDTKLAAAQEGQQSIVQALETRLQKETADLQQRRIDESVACNNRGVALYYRGAHEAARAAFEKALELQPEYAEAFNNLGLTLSKLGMETEATEAFRKALTIDPKMGEAYNNLGFLYHTAAQFDRAAQMFDLAIENAADSSIAYTNLGNTYHAMENADKAIEAWRRAVDLDPLNEGAQRGLRMYAQEAANN